jgi:hypothetical protein
MRSSNAILSFWSAAGFLEKGDTTKQKSRKPHHHGHHAGLSDKYNKSSTNKEEENAVQQEEKRSDIIKVNRAQTIHQKRSNPQRQPSTAVPEYIACLTHISHSRSKIPIRNFLPKEKEERISFFRILLLFSFMVLCVCVCVWGIVGYMEMLNNNKET